MNLRMTICSVVVLAGCGKKAPDAADAAATPNAPDAAATAPDAAATAPDAAATAPDAAAPDATTAPDAAAAPADCAPADVMRTLGGIDPDWARLDGRKVELCGAGEADRRCVTLDLDSGKRTSAALPENDATHLPSWPTGFDDGLLKDETRPVLKLCPADATRCKDLHVGQALAGRFDATKARVAITSFDDGKINAHVYDTASLEEKLVVPIGQSDLPDCSFAAFLGDALLVSHGACSGGGTSWIADGKTGAKLFDVAKKADAFVLGGQYAAVEGSVWALRDANGKAVYLQDVASGDVVATIDLEKALEGSKPKDQDAFVFATPTEIVLVESRPLPGTVITAARKDGAITKVYTPRPCP